MLQQYRMYCYSLDSAVPIDYIGCWLYIIHMKSHNIKPILHQWFKCEGIIECLDSMFVTSFMPKTKNVIVFPRPTLYIHNWYHYWYYRNILLRYWQAKSQICPWKSPEYPQDSYWINMNKQLPISQHQKNKIKCVTRNKCQLISREDTLLIKTSITISLSS